MSGLDRYADPSALVARAADRVAEIVRSTPKMRPPPVVYDALHEAAAVLAWFDPDQLSPVSGQAAPGAIDELLTDAQLTADVDGNRRWTLEPRMRIACLRQLRETGLVRAALDANPERPSGPVQLAIEEYLGGLAAPVDRQPKEQIVASHVVCEWLRAAGFDNIPESGEFRQRIDWLTLLEPFEFIAGDFFRGRVKELARLRSFADVVPPGSFKERAHRVAVRAISGNKEPLLIYGPGGVGKSALIGRFVLEHARALEVDRFPFVFLDFDRPDVDASEPLTLLVEAVRQLGIEYPRAREACERIREFWLGSLSDRAGQDQVQPGSGSGGLLRPSASRAVRDFASLIESLGAASRPVLFVLDTFEEVQWRSDESVTAICALLDELQSAIGRLRVCIVSRGQLPYTSNELALTGLDHEAAAGYLSARGVTDRDLADSLARQLGGNPLTLKLAAELIRREGLGGERLDVRTRREFFGVRLADEVVQRQLYGRILGYIHDQDVAKLVHPGLILRRITADLILHVLAEPCGLKITSIEQARVLFGKLGREVSLVSRVSSDVLEHRQDLRKLMIGLLERDNPLQTKAIHELAVLWYEVHGSTRADRAEEIYHRLCLDQSPKLIDTRWQPGIKQYLATAFSEFQGARKAYLARHLGLSVDEQTRQLADLEDWERLVARQGQDLAEQSRYEEALRLINSRAGRTAQSPLFVLEAILLANLGRWQEGLAALDRGVDRATADGARWQVLNLEINAAELILSLPKGLTSWQQQADRLAGVAGESLPPADRLNMIAHVVALAGGVDRAAALDDQMIELRVLLDGMTDQALADHRSASQWAASVLADPADVRRVARVLRTCGLPDSDGPRLRELAAAVAALDARRPGRPGGFLEKISPEFSLRQADSLTSAWSDFLLTQSEDEVGRVLARLLDENAPEIPGELVRAFAIALTPELHYRDRRPDRIALQAAANQSPKVGARILDEIVDVLLSVFPTEVSLRNFQQQSLDLSYYSYDPYQGQDMRSIVRRLVTDTLARGSLEQLIVRALERFPANLKLLEIAGYLGIFTLNPRESPSVSEALRNSTIDADLWRTRLDSIQYQVCRLERDCEPIGTGFLVGTDLVLTAGHVVLADPDQELNPPVPADLRVRFGLIADRQDQVVSAGAVFPVDRVLAHSGNLDFALLQVRGAPGVLPVDSEWQGPGGRLRGWIDLTRPTPLGPERDLATVSYHGRRRQRIDLDVGPAVELSSDGTRLTYQIQPEAGSSGAPCFNYDLELVAMNIGKTRVKGERREVGFGVSAAAIVDYLRGREMAGLVAQTFA